MKKVVLGTAAVLGVMALGFGVYTAQKDSSGPSPPGVQGKDRRLQGTAASTVDRTPVEASPSRAAPLPTDDPSPMPPAPAEPPPLEPGKARVEGVLLGARRTPLAAYIVKGIRLEGGNGRRPASGVTDAAGRFSLNNLEPGSYWLCTTGAKPPNQQFPPIGQETVITLAANEVKKGIVLRLNDGLTIAGRVVDEQGAPMKSVEVSANPDGDLALMDQLPLLSEVVEEVQGQLDAALHLHGLFTTTAADGRFRLLGLADADYVLVAAQMGYRQPSQRVHAGESNLEIVLERLEIAISGQVVDALTGRPLPKFEVGYGSGWQGRSGGASNNVKMTGVSDPNGRFSLVANAMHSGGYVIASAKGYALDAVNIKSAMTDYARAENVIVALKPSRKVRGRAVDDDGKGLSEAHIFIGHAPNADFSSVVSSAIGATDSSGNFAVEIASGEEVECPL